MKTKKKRGARVSYFFFLILCHFKLCSAIETQTDNQLMMTIIVILLLFIIIICGANG